MLKIISSANTRYLKSKYYFFSIKNLFKRFISAYTRTIDPKQQPTLDLTKYEDKKIPATLQEKEDSIAEYESKYGMIEAQRLKQIDKLLNTSTYFQHTRYFQKRLDSQNILSIKKMKNKYQYRLRNMIKGLQDPQKPSSYKIRNRKMHNLMLAKIRQYPTHLPNINILDVNDPQTTNFLTKQILFTRLSFKDIQIMKSTFLQQEFSLPPQLILTSKYVYFKKQNDASVYRIFKEKYYSHQNKQEFSIVDVDQVLAIKQIYDALKIYDQDPRIEKYLEKYQNSTLETILDKMIWSHTQRYIGIFINITLQQQQYCVIIKDTLTGLVYKQIFFNINKDAIIYNNQLIYIKTSELGYNQVYQFNLETKQNILIYTEKQQNRLRLRMDPSFQVFYLYRTRLQNDYDQQVLVYGFQKPEFIPLLDYRKFKYQVYLSQQGFIYTNYEETKNQQETHINIDAVSKEIYIIPFQEQNTLMKIQEQKRVQKLQTLQQLINQINSLNLGKNIKKPEVKKKMKKISKNHQLLFRCDDNQWIKDITLLQTHLVCSIFNKWASDQLYSKIKFFPFKETSMNSQLILKDQIVNLYPYQDYRGQNIRFETQNVFNTHFIYNIWKKQLTQAYPNEFHQETFNFKTRDDYEISTTIYCQKKYIGKVLPAIIFVPTSQSDMIDQEIMMALLKKGILVCIFRGRGSLLGNYTSFKDGIKQNIFKSATDIVDTAIYLIQQKLSDNVSLYGKGMFGGIVGLYANIIYPQIFTATSLYNGIYDINNPIINSNQFVKKLVGDFQKQQIKQFWAKNSPHQLQIKTSNKTEHNIYYDRLQNILLSQNIHLNFQSRKLIYKLRSSKRRFQELYYQEFTNQKEADLENCCYLFKNMLNSYTKQY